MNNCSQVFANETQHKKELYIPQRSRIFSEHFQKTILFGIIKNCAKIVRILGLVLEKNEIDLLAVAVIKVIFADIFCVTDGLVDNMVPQEC